MLSIKSTHASVAKNEEGFTLIELLVVILIIGILSAIAVPAFLNQRKAAADAMVESDVRNAVAGVHTYFIKYPTAENIQLSKIQPLVNKSDGVRMSIAGTKDDFCIAGYHKGSARYTDWQADTPPNARPYYMYQSKNGGTQDKTSYLSNLPCSANGVSTWD